MCILDIVLISRKVVSNRRLCGLHFFRFKPGILVTIEELWDIRETRVQEHKVSLVCLISSELASHVFL